ncbi:unnamed protein product [Hyaloperonospora brassicae]|uniref:Minichromosome loss protein Mcl1 middle region domain-containing protein n=1 Tax=Hyaloperonospora brassicae TaxID=162125 RepID=A0AAV0UL13_HYABA|nr:unnamed protein product [Hyaloperonospora brassicae]
MWNQALRRVVRAEERQCDTRRRQQLAQAAASSASTSSSAASAPSSSTVPPVSTAAATTSPIPSIHETAPTGAPDGDKRQARDAANSVDHVQPDTLRAHTADTNMDKAGKNKDKAGKNKDKEDDNMDKEDNNKDKEDNNKDKEDNKDNEDREDKGDKADNNMDNEDKDEDEDEDEDGDDYLQKHLLSQSTSVWRCLEDTQQANCLALNAPHSLLAVGERDGRVTIWDNTTIRVITRELDPTLIALPTSEAVTHVEKRDGPSDGTVKQMDAGGAEPQKGLNEGLVAGNGSVEGRIQDGEDEKGEEEEKTKTLMRERLVDNEADSARIEERQETTSGGPLLTSMDLRVAKTALKVVTQCAWSCDSQWLFAGCEEKSTRRARLCVWNVEAATLVSAFQFDGTITALSAHPRDPKLVVVSHWNSRPVLLDVVSGMRTVLESVPLENEEITQSTPQSNSKHPLLASCARFGRSGKRIYCATSKSTLAVLDAATLQCLDSLKLSVVIQFVDLRVNLRETAMLLTSSKGIHEFAMDPAVEAGTSKHARDAACAAATEDHSLGVREVALHSTGAVRAPWAVCCFSGGEEFVVGTPVVRHRHVGENGLFTWHRASNHGKTTAQHNAGVKDGVLALAWDRLRQSVLAVSTSGALHVLEEQFTTTWPGAMYPAGFRLITDNEVHLDVFDRDAEERKREKEELTEAAKRSPVDVFTMKSPSAQFPSEYDTIDPEMVVNKLCYIPAIPIEHYHRQHLHQVHEGGHNEDNDFGLGQSIFEPLKSALVEHDKKNARKSRNSSAKNPKRRRR